MFLWQLLDRAQSRRHARCVDGQPRLLHADVEPGRGQRLRGARRRPGPAFSFRPQTAQPVLECMLVDRFVTPAAGLLRTLRQRELTFAGRGAEQRGPRAIEHERVQNRVGGLEGPSTPPRDNAR